MTDIDLDAIEARANAAMLSPTGQQYDAAVVLSTDVPALVAEVRRLRDIEAEAYRRALDVIEAEREDETVALTDVGLVLAANAVRVLLNAAVTRGGAS